MQNMILSDERIKEIKEIKKEIDLVKTFSKSNKTFYKTDTLLKLDTNKAEAEPLFNKIITLLQIGGWIISNDPDIEKDYPILNYSHKYASKGELRITLRYYPAGVELKIFPIYNTENKAGPRYGFNPFMGMDYLDRKRSSLIFKFLTDEFAKLDYIPRNLERKLNAREDVEFRIRESWHFKEYDTNHGISECAKNGYNGLDSDKKQITNGQVKYFEHYGQIIRGTTFHNINNMWWIVINKDSFTNIASFDLFDSPSSIKLRRKDKSGIKRKIEQLVKEKDFRKTNLLKDKLWMLSGNLLSDQRYVIQCRIHEHKKVLWWAWNDSGYTEDIELAGHYNLNEATSTCKGSRGEIMFKLEDYKNAKKTLAKDKKKFR